MLVTIKFTLKATLFFKKKLELNSISNQAAYYESYLNNEKVLNESINFSDGHNKEVDNMSYGDFLANDFRLCKKSRYIDTFSRGIDDNGEYVIFTDKQIVVISKDKREPNSVDNKAIIYTKEKNDAV